VGLVGRALEFPFGSAELGWVSVGEVSIGLPASAIANDERGKSPVPHVSPWRVDQNPGNTSREKLDLQPRHNFCLIPPTPICSTNSLRIVLRLNKYAQRIYVL
jgi:hypothetical protein